MATGFRFDADGALCSGEYELARLDLTAPGVYGRVLVGDKSYDISRRHPHGWGFTLHGPAGPPLAAFRQARLGRGGKLAGDGIAITLKPRPFRSEWQIAFPGRAPLEVSARSGRTETLPDGRRRTTLGAGIRDELLVTAPEGVPATVGWEALLAFACWLIREFQSIPSVGDSGAG
jgi:hypothetical protein